MTISLGPNGETNEWVNTYQDLFGRIYRTEYPAVSGTVSGYSIYNSSGQLVNQIDQDGIVKIFGYNTTGELQTSAVSSNKVTTLDLTKDRATRTARSVVASDNRINNQSGRLIQTYGYKTFGNSTSNLLAEELASTNGLLSLSIRYNNGVAFTTKTEQTYNPATHIRTITVTAPDNSTRVSTYSLGLLQSEVRTGSGAESVSSVSYTYDSHNRVGQQTDARNGATVYGYNNYDQLVQVTAPSLGDGQNPQVTSTQYDAFGKPWIITQPDGSSMTNEYHPTGLLKKTYGSRTYPVEYTYDTQGRMRQDGKGQGQRI